MKRVEIGLQPIDQVGPLPIVAGLNAAGESAGIDRAAAGRANGCPVGAGRRIEVVGEGGAQERDVAIETGTSVTAGPGAAGVQAGIEAGPAENWGRWRRRRL